MKLKQMLQNALFTFDLYGQPIGLLQKKREKYNTTIGSISSIFVLIITTYSLISMIMELYERTEPNIVSKIESTPNPDVTKVNKKSCQLFYINPDDYFFYLAVGDSTGNIIQNLENKVFYEVYMSYCDYQIDYDSKTGKRQVTENCTYLDMVNCSTIEFPDQKWIDFDIKKEQLGNYFCINQAQWKTNFLALQGVISSRNVKSFEFGFMKCQNRTDFNSKSLNIIFQLECASTEEIDQQLNRGMFIFSMTDRLLDQKKIGDGFTNIKKDFLIGYSTEQVKSLQIYLRHTYLETIENFLYYYPVTFTNHVLTFLERKESNYDIVNNINAHLSITFLLDDKKSIFYRTYSNILNIFGDISGLFEVLQIVIGIFVSGIAKNLQNNFLVNLLLSFEPQSSGLNYSQKIFPLKETRKRSQNTRISQIISSELKIILDNQQAKQNKRKSLNIKEIKRFIKKKEKKISLSFFSLLNPCDTSTEKEQVQFGIEKIENKLDVGYILKKLIEVDKLKTFLLDQHQLKLFDYIPKPTIYLNKNQNLENWQSIYFQEDKSFEIRVLEALDAYKVCQNRSTQDQKLVDMLDQEIKEAFDEVLRKILQIQSFFLDKQVMFQSPNQELKVISSKSPNKEELIFQLDHD